MARIIGTPDSDTLYSRQGEETEILGLSGDDLLFAGSAEETLDGGAGVDWVYYTTTYSDMPVFTYGVTVNLNEQMATYVISEGGTSRRDTLLNIENFRGSNFDDTLTGDGADNEIQGFDGDDLIFGLGGNDRMFGGDGKDTLHGGDGDDRIFATIGNQVLQGDAGTDYVSFGTTKSNAPLFQKGVTADLSSDIGQQFYHRLGFVSIEGSDCMYITNDDAQFKGSMPGYF